MALSILCPRCMHHEQTAQGSTASINQPDPGKLLDRLMTEYPCSGFNGGHSQVVAISDILDAIEVQSCD